MKLLLILLLLSFPTFALADEWNPDVHQFKQWQRVLDNETFKDDPDPFTGQIKPLLAKRFAYWRRFAYKSDWINYFSIVDYWATRKEFRQKRSGDCEDYALAVMFDLLDAGVADDRMYIAVVVLSDGETHAVLVVDEKYVADNKHKTIISYKKFAKGVKFMYRLNRLGWRP